VNGISNPEIEVQPFKVAFTVQNALLKDINKILVERIF